MDVSCTYDDDVDKNCAEEKRKKKKALCARNLADWHEGESKESEERSIQKSNQNYVAS
jgi:hypothetical protein